MIGNSGGLFLNFIPDMTRVTRQLNSVTSRAAFATAGTLAGNMFAKGFMLRNRNLTTRVARATLLQGRTQTALAKASRANANAALAASKANVANASSSVAVAKAAAAAARNTDRLNVAQNSAATAASRMGVARAASGKASAIAQDATLSKILAVEKAQKAFDAYQQKRNFNGPLSPKQTQALEAARLRSIQTASKARVAIENEAVAKMKAATAGVRVGEVDARAKAAVTQISNVANMSKVEDKLHKQRIKQSKAQERMSRAAIRIARRQRYDAFGMARLASTRRNLFLAGGSGRLGYGVGALGGLRSGRGGGHGGGGGGGRGGFAAAGGVAGAAYGNGFQSAFNRVGANLLTGTLPGRGALAGIFMNNFQGISAQIAAHGGGLGGVFTTAFLGGLGALQTGLLAIVGGATMAAGATIVGGVKRALNIEDAEAKLTGLRYTGEQTKSIMADVEKSVIGTRFSLDQAVMIGSSALAAGIKPGQELTQYLQTTADAATIAGVNLDQMGRIMNKITANSVLYAQEGNQLADKSLPIWAWLADARGVTVRELKKLVEQGKVSAEETRQVIEKNIGGVALQSANTTRGAFKNMIIAYQRLGAVISGGSLPIFKEIFRTSTQFADFLAKKLSPTMKAVWESFTPAAITWVKDFGASIILLANGGYGISTLAQNVKNLTAAFGGAQTGSESMFKNANGSWKSLQDILQGIRNDLAWLEWGFVDAGNGLKGAFKTISGDSTDELKSLMPLLKELGTSFGTAFNDIKAAMGPALQSLWPVLVKFASILTQSVLDVLIALTPVLSQVLPVMADYVVRFLDVLSAAMPSLLKFFETFSPISIILQALEGLMGKGSGMWSDFGKSLKDMFEKVQPILILVGDALKGLWDQFANVMANEGKDAMISIFESLMNLGIALAPVLKNIMPLIGSIGIALAQTFIEILRIALPLIEKLVPIIATQLGAALGAFSSFVTGFLPFFLASLPDLTNMVADLVNIIIKAMPDMQQLMAAIMNPELLHFIMLFAIGLGAIVKLLLTIASLFGPIAQMSDLMDGKFSHMFETKNDPWTQGQGFITPYGNQTGGTDPNKRLDMNYAGLTPPSGRESATYNMTINNATEVDGELVVEKINDYLLTQGQGRRYEYDR